MADGERMAGVYGWLRAGGPIRHKAISKPTVREENEGK